MRTVSYSLDEETAQGIDNLAKQLKLSRSDVVRSMFARLQLEHSFESMQAQAEPLLAKLGLSSEEDVAYYSKHGKRPRR